MEIDHVFASGAVVGRATTHSWGRLAPHFARGDGGSHSCVVARPTTAPDAKMWSIPTITTYIQQECRYSTIMTAGFECSWTRQLHSWREDRIGEGKFASAHNIMEVIQGIQICASLIHTLYIYYIYIHYRLYINRRTSVYMYLSIWYLPVHIRRHHKYIFTVKHMTLVYVNLTCELYFI